MYVFMYAYATQNGLLQGPWFIWPNSSFSSDTVSNDGRQRSAFLCLSLPSVGGHAV